jgi:hypothetical protein
LSRFEIHPRRFFVTFPRFTIEQSDTEFYTSQSGMALVGLAVIIPSSRATWI